MIEPHKGERNIYVVAVLKYSEYSTGVALKLEYQALFRIFCHYMKCFITAGSKFIYF